MDTVLGVSMAPKTVNMVLVEGQNANGVTVEEDNFAVGDGQGSAADSGPNQVISAILGTQEGAAESGYQLLSTGVTWTDPTEAAALQDALAAHKMENVMLVSAFLAAAALAQEIGNATGYEQTALLFVEPDTATLAMVNTADGAISEVRRQPLQSGDPSAELAAMVADADTLPTRPGGLFLVGSGVDIAPIKPALEAATSLFVSAPEEPETALARGAALASANAPLFSSSTQAMAYAQDPGTGAIDPYAVAPHYLDAGAAGAGGKALAYSAVADDEANAYTAVAGQADVGAGAYPEFGGDHAAEQRKQRRPFWMVASAVAAIFLVGVVALVIALAMNIRPSVGTRPNPGHQLVAPTPPPPPNAPPPGAPAPPPAAPAPGAPAPAAPAPAPAAPAPAAPAPEAPAPAPAAPAPPPAVPQVPNFNPPAPVGPPGGFPGGPGIPGIPGGGGIPGIPGGGGFPGGGGHGGGGGGGHGGR